MRWEDERYVRLYTRDTLTWRQLGWWGQCCLALLMRKVDRAGVMEMGDLSPAESLQLATELPDEVVAEGWKRLAKTKTVLVREATETLPRALVLPNFLEAQEARSSDKARQQKSRDLARVTKRDDASPGVTNRHTASHGVTPSLAVPSLAVETKALSTSQAKLDDVREVFAYWQQVMARPRTKLDDVRRRKIQARLSEGRSVADIKLAIDGCSMRGHNMGDNENGTAYNDIELICRNGPKFEGYLLTAEEAKRPAASPAYHRETDEEIEQRILGGKHAV